MKKKILNYFHHHRIIDTHIGIWDFHIWLYCFASYFSMMYIFSIFIKFYIPIFEFSLDLMRGGNLIGFKFKILGFGVDTERKYYENVSKWYEEYREKRNKAFKEFKNSLTKKELDKAKQYCRLK